MIRHRMQAQVLSVLALTAMLAAPAAERVDRCAPLASQGPVSRTRDEFLHELRTEFALADGVRQGGTVTIAERTDISTVNGLLVESWPTRHITQLIFEKLATISPIDGTPVPQLADYWEVSEDGRTYTFHLSQEAKWHDGVDFTAHDVEFSFDIVKDTSLASVVAMPDLLKQATDAQALMANPSPLIAAAAIYLIILWPLVRLVAYLEHRDG